MNCLRDPWKAFWSWIWELHEKLSISFGRLAPWVFAQMIGCSKYKRIK